LNNLADNPKYQEKLNELRAEMDKWLKAISDNPDLPERELIKKLWNGKDTQPSTSEPIISNDNGKVTINCETKGASIGFKVVKNGEKAPKSWEVYKSAINIPKGVKLLVQAHRIGFRPSSVIEIQ
jgi:N-sulfoglucosamine sulfohydrolase